jgi:triosephosphate isomerase
MIWIGTSWKMHKTLAEARTYASALSRMDFERWRGIQPFVIPPATALDTMRIVLGEQGPVLLGAQNAHWEDAGPWTGEISVPQVADAGARIVEIGHAERRAYFGETNDSVNRKVRATLRHGLVPLVCVGESAEAFRAGDSVEHVLTQARAALKNVREPNQALLAYEPTWAIGTIGRPATPAEIAEVVAALRIEHGSVVQAILYGGSVDRGNALETLRVPGVGGLFIGRSAWSVEGLVEILDAVAGALRAGSLGRL